MQEPAKFKHNSNASQGEYSEYEYESLEEPQEP